MVQVLNQEFIVQESLLIRPNKNIYGVIFIMMVQTIIIIGMVKVNVI